MATTPETTTQDSAPVLCPICHIEAAYHQNGFSDCEKPAPVICDCGHRDNGHNGIGCMVGACDCRRSPNEVRLASRVKALEAALEGIKPFAYECLEDLAADMQCGGTWTEKASKQHQIWSAVICVLDGGS